MLVLEWLFGGKRDVDKMTHCSSVVASWAGGLNGQEMGNFWNLS